MAADDQLTEDGYNEHTANPYGFAPDMLDRFNQWKQAVKDQLGLDVVVTEGYRDPKRSDELKAQGKIALPGGYSYHNFGEAFDYGFRLANGKTDLNNDAAYHKAGQIARQFGLTDISNETGHIQNADYRTSADLRKAYPNGYTPWSTATAGPDTGPPHTAATERIDYGNGEKVDGRILGSFGYIGDATPDANSLSGIGAYNQHMIPGYSAGLSLAAQKKYGIKPGQEFTVGGHTFRLDDTNNSEGQQDYVDVYNPTHAPDKGFEQDANRKIGPNGETEAELFAKRTPGEAPPGQAQEDKSQDTAQSNAVKPYVPASDTSTSQTTQEDQQQPPTSSDLASVEQGPEKPERPVVVAQRKSDDQERADESSGVVTKQKEYESGTPLAGILNGVWEQYG